MGTKHAAAAPLLAQENQAVHFVQMMICLKKKKKEPSFQKHKAQGTRPFLCRGRLIFASSKKQPVYTFARIFVCTKIKIGELDLTHLEQMGIFYLASWGSLNWS